MKNNQNITILLLTISAAILTVMLVVTMTETSQEAVAGASAKEGDYIMATGRISSAYDAVYVVDVVEERLIVYWVNPDNNRPEILDAADLDRAFR